MNKHLIIQKHEKNTTDLPKSLDYISMECIICCEKSNEFKKCICCKQSWCMTCDKNIFECPYCRHVINGRQENLRKRKLENFTLQTDDEIFINTIDEMRMDRMIDSEEYNVDLLMTLFFGRPLR